MKIAYRKAGVIQAYIGIDSQGSGWFDDFDGKWVYLTLDGVRTIGNTSSNADIAVTWGSSLFSLLFDRYTDAQCPVYTSGGMQVQRSGGGTSAWANNYRITLPDFRGRVIAGAGSGLGLTFRQKGTAIGEQQHTLSIAEMPPHDHYDRHLSSLGSGTAGYAGNIGTLSQVLRTYQTGSGSAFNMYQPTAFEHLIISAGAR